ncbi:carboxypeptidase-like regulatory domain-containing protein, partial [Singulisphaera rosea]
LPMALGLDSGVPPADGRKDQSTRTPERATSPRAIEFRVIHKSSRQPLEGVTIKGQVDGNLQPGVSVDNEGRFRLAVPESGAHAFDVWVKKDGFVPLSYSWSRREGGDDIPNTVTLTMEAGTTIGGLIRDAGGRPVRDATVLLLVPGDQVSRRQKTDIGDYPVKTDAEGRWRCDVMPSKLDDVWIRLSHPDFAVDTTYGATPKPSMAQLRDQTGVMVMKKGLVLEGQVLDLEGRPIGGASVAQGSDRWGTEYPDTITNAQGRFRFGGIKPGEVTLTVQAKGRAPDVKSMVLEKEGESVEFRLGPGRTIRGRVLDPAGQGIGGVTVVADTWRSHRSIDFRAKTDKDGRFRWEDAPKDEVIFHIAPMDEYVAIRDCRLTTSDQESTITLARPLIVRGTVTDAETGRPIEAFTLHGGFGLGRDTGPFFLQDRGVPTRAGRYAFRFNEPRPRHYLRFEAEGYRTVVSRPFRDDEGASVFDVRMRRGTAIGGVVHSLDGGPLEGAEVVLLGSRDTLLVEEGHLLERRSHPLVTTGSDGRFSFNPEDEATSIVVVHDMGWAFTEMKKLAAAPVLRLKPWGRIAGVFRLGKRPGGDDPIMAVSRTDGREGEAPGVEFRSTTTTDVAGRFALEKVPVGEVEVCRSVRQNNQYLYETHSVPVSVRPGQTSRVTIGGLGRSVVGRVSSPADRPAVINFSSSFNLLTRNTTKASPPPGLDDAGRARWEESAEGKEYRRGRFSEVFKLSADGAFRIDDVTPGRYEITISMNEPPPATPKNGNGGDRFETLTHTFDVPDISEKPMDLGTLNLIPFQSTKSVPSETRPSP